MWKEQGTQLGPIGSTPIVVRGFQWVKNAGAEKTAKLLQSHFNRASKVECKKHWISDQRSKLKLHLSVIYISFARGRIKVYETRGRTYVYEGSVRMFYIIVSLIERCNTLLNILIHIELMSSIAVNIASRTLNSLKYACKTFFQRHAALLVANNAVCLISGFDLQIWDGHRNVV